MTGVVVERSQDHDKGLDVELHREWLTPAERMQLWNMITQRVEWFRVCYTSARFQKECETPCWTTFFGGVKPEQYPYVKIPDWLRPLVDRASKQFLREGTFNAILVRLYFDGDDEIAWHTDSRKFLGPSPTIVSLSLGASTRFEMRRMTNVWPATSGGRAARSQGNGVDSSTPIRRWNLGDGDLFVMRGSTQNFWHHRVPKEKGRRPRINLNFRYIVPNGPDAARGQATFYKYMVHGDKAKPPSYTFAQLLRNRADAVLPVGRTDNANAHSDDVASNRQVITSGGSVRPAVALVQNKKPTHQQLLFAVALAQQRNLGLTANQLRDEVALSEFIDRWKGRGLPTDGKVVARFRQEDRYRTGT